MGVPRYLKFENADWQLDGSAEPGLYPIEAMQRTWHLDKGRPKTVLGVQRWQLPLVPAFAITAHSSQGKTLPLAPSGLLHTHQMKKPRNSKPLPLLP